MNIALSKGLLHFLFSVPHQKDTTESTAASRLIEEIKRLQSEKSAITQKLSECELELSASQEEIKRLQEMVHQMECGKLVSSHEEPVKRERNDTVSVLMCFLSVFQGFAEVTNL